MQHVKLVVVPDSAPGIIHRCRPRTTSVRVCVRVHSVWNSSALRIIIINLHMCAAPPWYGPCEQNGMRRPLPLYRSFYSPSTYYNNRSTNPLRFTYIICINYDVHNTHTHTHIIVVIAQ